jgi:hypothetical protein
LEVESCGAALFEHVKNAARGLGLAPVQPHSTKGQFVSTKGSTSKGKGKAAIKQPLAAVDNSNNSVKVVPSDAVTSLTQPAKWACGGKAQITDLIISLTNHIITKDAKYKECAEALFAHHWELMQEMVSPLAVVGAGMLDVLKELAQK